MTATATPTQTERASTPRPRRRDFGYFDQDDQLGVIGWGASVEEAFEAVAQGVFAVVADSQPVDPERLAVVDFEESDLERALVTWVDRVLELARDDCLDLRRFNLRHLDHHWYADVWGTPRNMTAASHTRNVRGANPNFVKVELVDGVWEARCLVDW